MRKFTSYADIKTELHYYAPREALIDQAYHHLEDEPWMWFFPGMLIVTIVLAINFLGDGLRDALNPQARI